MHHCVHFTHLVGSQSVRHPLGRCFEVRNKFAVVPSKPLRGLRTQNAFTFCRVADVSGWQVEVAPIHTMQFRHGWVPCMMGVGKTHPAEHVVFIILRREPVHCSVGYPARVVPLKRHGVVLHLRCTSIATAHFIHLQFAVDDGVEHVNTFRMILAYPLGVVQRTHCVMRSEFKMLKTAVRFFSSIGIFVHHSFHALSSNGVFCEERKGVEEWFEVRFANE